MRRWSCCSASWPGARSASGAGTAGTRSRAYSVRADGRRHDASRIGAGIASDAQGQGGGIPEIRLSDGQKPGYAEPSRFRLGVGVAAPRLVLIVLLIVCLLAAPLAAEAQQPGKVVRIGYLSPEEPPTPAAPSSNLEAFKEGLRGLGYVEGRHFTVETRLADAKLDRLPGLARELLGLNVDVIVTIGTPTIKAAKEATATIPIVMAGSADPVEHGLVASLAHPGGNVTGVTHSPGPEISAKGIQLLKEAAPRVSRVAALWDSSGIHEGRSLEQQRAAARELSLTLLPFDAKTLDELTAALVAIKRERADGLFVFPNFINGKHFNLIRDFATINRLPTAFQGSWEVEHGGLLSYYTNWLALRRRAVVFVDKILKGAKPGDLAVEQPTKFDLVINLNAKMLGLTIPPALLLRADKVISD